MELPLNMEKKEKTIPGDPSLVSSDDELLELAKLDVGDYRYKVEDYFARPKASTFRFSPDGRYMSYREKDENGKRHVMVKDIATGEVKRAIEEKEELVRAYGWISNERLAYLMDSGGDENYHVYAVNLDGSALKDLTPFDGVRAEFTELLKEDKNHIIISMNMNNPQVFEPYKVNVVTGEMEQLFTNDDPTNPIVGYDFDKDGHLKAYTRMRDGVEQDLFYEDGKGGYGLIKSLNWKDSFGILEFNYATENPHDAYVISNLTNDKAEIILYDLKEDKILSKVFSNDRYDVDDMGTSRKRGYELDYVSFEGEKTEIVPISAHYKKLHDKIVN
ncbi:MAG: S9 family peptidase, partial [Bacteroidota bacterium]